MGNLFYDEPGTKRSGIQEGSIVRRLPTRVNDDWWVRNCKDRDISPDGPLVVLKLRSTEVRFVGFDNWASLDAFEEVANG